jgi:adenosylcobinamide-phosphate synthase
MFAFNSITIPLIIGFILDSILGDPLWLPHPIRWFGNTIFLFEKKWNNKNHRKLKGSFMVVLLVLSTYFIFQALINLFSINIYAYYISSSLFVFYGLANRNLISESLKVEQKLTKEGIESGRKQLSNIVGRDTSLLSENKIRIAVLETLSENLSDGVIAPILYYAIGGVPLMFAYKMINTLDSMIGYKSERYRDFGFFAAKLDDIANFIPARITSLLMVLISGSYRGFKFIFLFGHKHASPNAGYPEAALAGILNCQFGGSNIYHGTLIEKPFIGNNERLIYKKDIYKACLINYITSLVFLLFLLL